MKQNWFSALCKLSFLSDYTYEGTFQLVVTGIRGALPSIFLTAEAANSFTGAI